MIESKLLEKIDLIAENKYHEMEFISDFLFKNPELGKKEFVAAKFLCDIARNMGFEVTTGYCGLDTAFLAELKNGEGPVIALIAEYDALPGFGPNGEPAHACGHNWISAVSFGAAMILSELKSCFSGTIRILGTPAMENIGCKVDMIKAHAFDDVDLAIQSHLEQNTCIHSVLLALDAIEFSFKGRASHASVALDGAINALDAVQFMFVGINALRGYLRSDVKIHGIIKEGGLAPSVITENASCQFYIRALDRSYLDEIRPQIIRCAEGAALMAGAEMNYSFFENSYDNIIHNSVLLNIAHEYLEKENIYDYDRYNEEISFASSDIGNVSHICPTLYMEISMDVNGKFQIHDKSALTFVNSRYSNKRLHQISKITAAIALEVLSNPKLLATIKQEHRENIKHKI